MRIVYLGTPDEAVGPLETLAQHHDVALVVTQPARRRTRRGARSPSPVEAAARELGLDVRTPDRAIEVADAVRSSGAALGVVVAFGQLLPEALLDALPHGFVNLHLSLLPRWRGAAPVERAILADDDVTGVCVMAIDAGLDTGAVYARRSVTIGPRETAGELTARLVDLGTELLVETLPTIPDATPEPQIGASVTAPKITVEEFELDWSLSAAELDRVVRAGNPRPGAWTTLDGARLKVWRSEPTGPRASGTSYPSEPPRSSAVPGAVDRGGVVVTGEGGLQLVEVQPAGRRAMSADAWLAGRRGALPVLGR